jgi:putative transposase
MPYWQLYYHIVWATKERSPLVTPEAEPVIYEFIRHKVLDLEGSLWALNGMPDHVHLVVSIPPKLAVAEFVGRIKSASTTRYNKLHRPAGPIFWQEDYGVFSFDKKRLPHCITYVEGQKQHHAQAHLIPALERDYSSDEPGTREPRLREPPPRYAPLPGAWWDELAATVADQFD